MTRAAARVAAKRMADRNMAWGLQAGE